MPTPISLQPTKNVTPQGPNLLDQLVGLLIVLAVIAVVVFGIILLVRWLFDKKEKAKDIYRQDYLRTIELCQIQKKPKFIKPIMGMPLWLASKGVPVMLRAPQIDYSKQYYLRPQRCDSCGRMGPPLSGAKRRRCSFCGKELPIVENVFNLAPGETYKLGTYAGSCTTQDGCFNLLVKSSHIKVMFLFPKLLVLKLRQPHVQRIYNPDERKDEFREVPPDSFSPSEDIIIVDCLGIDKIGQYYYAVNITKDGFVVDTKTYAYQDMIDISAQHQLIDVGRNMVSVADEWVRSNPFVQWTRKTDTGLTSE